MPYADDAVAALLHATTDPADRVLVLLGTHAAPRAQECTDPALGGRTSGSARPARAAKNCNDILAVLRSRRREDIMLVFLRAATLLLGLSLLPYPAGAASSLGALNVQFADLPASSTPLSDKDETPAQYAVATRTSLLRLRQDGLQQVNGRLFLLPFQAAEQPTQLTAIVMRFAMSTGAHTFYLGETSSLRSPAAAEASRLATGKLGQERIGLSALDTSTRPTTQRDLLVVRRGRYIVAFLLMYPNTQFGTKQFLHVAKQVDGRLQHAM